VRNIFLTSRRVFAEPTDCSDAAAYYSDRAEKCAGAFYGGDGTAVLTAICFILAVIAWVVATCMTLFMAIKFTVGMRVDKEMEVSYCSPYVEVDVAGTDT